MIMCYARIESGRLVGGLDDWCVELRAERACDNHVLGVGCVGKIDRTAGRLNSVWTEGRACGVG